MSSSPLVSVLLPFYNAEPYLEQAIRSVWEQDHRPLELVAVNDGSTDRSLEIAQALRKRSPIPMSVETQLNAGPSPALHRALGLSKGEWIAWIAADDLYATNFVSTSLTVAQESRIKDLIVHSNSFLMEESGRVTGTYTAVGNIPPLHGEAFEQRLLWQGFMTPQTMFIRREFLVRAGGFDPMMRVEDFDLILRLSRYGKFEFIEEPLYYVRHTPQSFGKKPWLWGEDIQRSLTKHADFLGPRLPNLLALWSEHIGAHSFEFGNPQAGLYWAIRAVRQTQGFRNKLIRIARLMVRASRGVFRYSAIRLIGHERLVPIKRILTGRRGAAAS
jgi:glycosyltransferase involved in cell wall biosynthesis